MDRTLAALQAASGLVSIFISVAALAIAREQLIPLRRDIERIASTQQRLRRIQDVSLRRAKPRTLAGFDPRFTSDDWNRIILSATGRDSPIKARLAGDHNSFHHDLRTNQAKYNDSIIIVDLLYVPELLHKKIIAPLDTDNRLDIRGMIKLRTDLHGTVLHDCMTEILERLCQDQDGVTGALPLWINTHGRMIPEPGLYSETAHLSSVSSFDDLLDRADADRVLLGAGVQSSYLTFEFFAHLAYRGCQLFGSPAAKTIEFAPRNHRDLLKLLAAVADLATRLRYSSITRATMERARTRHDFAGQSGFDLGHAGEARMIRDNIALWKPVFSSELLWKVFPQRDSSYELRLSDESRFRPPFGQRHSDGWSYLSALGGYGLALPYARRRDRSSQKALKNLFVINPCLMHPYLADMLPGECDQEKVVGFCARHSRPAWPFWHEVDDALGALLLDLILLLDRRTISAPKAFWLSARNTLLHDLRSRQRLDAFLVTLATIATKHGWQVKP